MFLKYCWCCSDMVTFCFGQVLFTISYQTKKTVQGVLTCFQNSKKEKNKK